MRMTIDLELGSGEGLALMRLASQEERTIPAHARYLLLRYLREQIRAHPELGAPAGSSLPVAWAMGAT